MRSWDEIMKIGEMIYFRVVMIGNIIGITKRLEGGGRAAGHPGAAARDGPSIVYSVELQMIHRFSQLWRRHG